MLSAYIWKWKNTDFCAVSVWVSVGPCIPEQDRSQLRTDIHVSMLVKLEMYNTTSWKK